MCVTSLQLCLTLCDPVDCGSPGCSVHGMPRTGVGFHSPAKILEWVSMLSSRGSSLPRDLTCVSYMFCIGRWILFHKHYLGSLSLSVSESGIAQLSPTLRVHGSVACHAPLSMEFSRQEYWSGFPFHSLGDLPDPGIKLQSPTLWADSLPMEPPGKPSNIS